jgi:hypothetical protein
MARGSGSIGQTFLFADLSGFTALTEAHGDEQAVDLVDGFCVAVRQLLAAHHAHEVKTIGDALTRTGDTAAAIRLGLCIVHDVGARHGFPLVRVGMHTGPAVERGGDWFGATVNLAARVSAAAAGGEALLTAATRDAATSRAAPRDHCGPRLGLVAVPWRCRLASRGCLGRRGHHGRIHRHHRPQHRRGARHRLWLPGHRRERHPRPAPQLDALAARRQQRRGHHQPAAELPPAGPLQPWGRRRWLPATPWSCWPWPCSASVDATSPDRSTPTNAKRCSAGRQAGEPTLRRPPQPHPAPRPPNPTPRQVLGAPRRGVLIACS